MATKTIGSAGGRDYATVQDWWAAIPAILTENEIGELYNDSLFSVTSFITLDGKTEGAFTITLRCATGQGFKDSQNNPGFKLQYDQSQGVAFSKTTTYQGVFAFNQAGLTVDGIQVQETDENSEACRVGGGSIFKNSIVDSNNTNASAFALSASGSGSTMINILQVNRNASAVNVCGFAYGSVGLNMTIVSSTAVAAPSTTGIKLNAGSPTVNNTACFGFSTCFGAFTSSNYNASEDASAPGANSIISQTYANQFVNTTNDWRLKAGASCIGASLTDAAALTDILGNTRGAAAGASDIGAEEFQPSTAAGLLLPLLGIGG